jgi:hypothetical protein
MDHGTGRYDSLTSIEDYRAILSDKYEVEVWKTSELGIPDSEKMVEYDLVIWTAGDYEDSVGDEESDLVFDVVFEGVPIILSGAFVGDSETNQPQRDIEVVDASHQVVDGFEVGEVVAFVTPPSGEVYETGLMDDVEADEITSVPLVRGPGSAEAGTPSMFVMEDDFTSMRLAFIGFPLYLLPEEPKARLIENTVEWLLRP